MKIKKNKNILFLWLNLSLLVPISLLPACLPERYALQPKSDIKKVYNLDLLKKEIKNLDENSLVIFDVDQTLFVSEGHRDNFANKKAQAIWRPLFDKLRRCTKAEGNNYLRHEMFFNSKRIPLDENIASIIETIKESKAKVIALTMAATGEIDSFGRLEILRFTDLKSLGIDFSNTFKEFQDLKLFELYYHGESSESKDDPHFSRHPVFYKGILLTAWYKKGEILRTFLDKVNWWPKKIIFIDDRLKYLKSVKKIAQERNIDFLGLEYRAAEVAPVDIEPKIAEFQMYYLMKDRKWISENEAKKIMKDRQITWKSIVKKYNIPKEKAAIKLNPKIYDAYVGEYETASSLIVSISKRENRLIVYAAGKGEVEIFPETAVKFFVKDFDAQISFIKDEKGKVIQLVWNQEEQKIVAKKVK